MSSTRPTRSSPARVRRIWPSGCRQRGSSRPSLAINTACCRCRRCSEARTTSLGVALSLPTVVLGDRPAGARCCVRADVALSASVNLRALRLGRHCVRGRLDARHLASSAWHNSDSSATRACRVGRTSRTTRCLRTQRHATRRRRRRRGHAAERPRAGRPFPHVHARGGLAVGRRRDQPHVARRFGGALLTRPACRLLRGPWYQPSYGGISQMASEVNSSTSLSMS